MTRATGQALALVTLAVVVRVGLVTMLGDVFHFVDETIYLDAAQRLLRGDGFDVAYANVPAYPVILAVMASPWPSDLLLVRCVQAVIAGAGCGLVLALGRRTFGPTPALVAALLYALDPLLGVTAGLLYPESIAALLLMVAVVASWDAARDDRLMASALAGLALGVVILCRPVALVIVPVLSLWTVWAVAARPLRRLVHALTLATCCLLAITPWAIRNQRLHGHVVPVEYPGLAGAPVAKTAIADQGVAASLVGRAWRDPGGLARHVASELGFFWELYPTRLAIDQPRQLEDLHRHDSRVPLTSPFGVSSQNLRNPVSAMSFGLELALAIVGVAVAWRRQRAATVLFLSVTFSYALGFALFVAKLRYRISVTPYILLFAGIGASVCGRVLANTWRGFHARGTAR